MRPWPRACATAGGEVVGRRGVPAPARRRRVARDSLGSGAWSSASWSHLRPRAASSPIARGRGWATSRRRGACAWTRSPAGCRTRRSPTCWTPGCRTTACGSCAACACGSSASRACTSTCRWPRGAAAPAASWPSGAARCAATRAGSSRRSRCGCTSIPWARARARCRRASSRSTGRRRRGATCARGCATGASRAAADAAAWRFRAADLDLADHVNNAVYWQVLEEELAGDGAREPFDAEIEHRAPADVGEAAHPARRPHAVDRRRDGEVLASLATAPGP